MVNNGFFKIIAGTILFAFIFLLLFGALVSADSNKTGYIFSSV